MQNTHKFFGEGRMVFESPERPNIDNNTLEGKGTHQNNIDFSFPKNRKSSSDLNGDEEVQKTEREEENNADKMMATFQNESELEKKRPVGAGMGEPEKKQPVDARVVVEPGKEKRPVGTRMGIPTKEAPSVNVQESQQEVDWKYADPEMARMFNKKFPDLSATGQEIEDAAHAVYGSKDSNGDPIFTDLIEKAWKNPSFLEAMIVAISRLRKGYSVEEVSTNVIRRGLE